MDIILKILGVLSMILGIFVLFEATGDVEAISGFGIIISGVLLFAFGSVIGLLTDIRDALVVTNRRGEKKSTVNTLFDIYKTMPSSGNVNQAPTDVSGQKTEEL